MAKRSTFLSWRFAGLVALAHLIFFLTLFGLADWVDQTALQREKTQLSNALDVSLKEIERRSTPIANWDDAVVHLDHAFDTTWAVKNVGEYFVQHGSMPVAYILDRKDRPVLTTNQGQPVSVAHYSGFYAAAAPLIAKVRIRERHRGRLLPPFRVVGEVTPPIQVTGIVSVGGDPFVVVASLVQPDMGKALPSGTRAPIIVNGEPLRGDFLKQIGNALLVDDLRFSSKIPQSRNAIPITDSRGHVAGYLRWSPWKPGEQLILFAFLPILLGVAVPLVLYLKSRAIAGTLSVALGELSQARDRADAALKAARESDEAKAKFLANMSHELRTPLNAIIGFSEMLKSETFRRATEEYAHIIHRSAQFLLALINDILDLSKIDAGKLELIESDVAMGALADECMTMLRPKAEAGQIVMRNEVSDTLPKLRGDQRYLRQILLNLLSNAAKFTGSGGEVVVRAAILDGGEMLCSVSDTGRGIPREDQAHVFEHFGQGRHDIVEKDKGTGLGLPIVRGLTEAHGGRVTLESAPGEGTRVSLIFPRERVQRSEQAKRAA